MTVVSPVLQRADGLALIGEAEGSGYRTPPALVRRADGQTLQLTPLLYAVVEAIDGRRTPEEIAEAVRVRTGKPVSADNVETLVEEQLRPLGVLTKPDGTQPELKRSNPLLGLRAKVAVTSPRSTRMITAPFTVLFSPLFWVPVLLVFLGVTWWLLMEQGLASAVKDAFDRPLLLLTVFAVTILSAGFHEFGHAAAARRGGAQPGVMGAGLYLVWPAFYTDVTDSYRLGRIGRLRTDLGGLYFNAIVAVGMVGLWYVVRWDAVLLVVVTQILQMLRQLLPLVRFDGYHVLADLTGVPDLFSRIGPVLTSFRPRRRSDPRVTALKPWVRVVITTWVLVTVPALLFALLAMVATFPRVAATAWESLRLHAAYLREAVGDMHLTETGAALLSMLAIALPVLAMAMIFWRVSKQVFMLGWTKSAGSAWGRAAVLGTTGAVIAGLVFLWWPRDGAYRPIEEGEKGTLPQMVGSVGRELPSTAYAPGRAAVSTVATEPSSAVTVLPEDSDLPTEAEPMRALVLIPASGTDPAATTDPAPVSGGEEDPTWVFPFDRPLPPDEGDTQAMAVNTTDHSVKYDVAMAMVWVEDQDEVYNTNEAIAYASCKDCVTVAVSFQVLVIVGQADVIVPQNTAEALNYNCFECITAAIAKQLVITVTDMPGEDKQVLLSDIWSQLAEFAATIPTLSVDAIMNQLEEFEEQIKAVLNDAVQAAPAAPLPTSAPSAGSSASADPDASGTTSTQDGSTSPSPSDAATPEPTAGATSQPSPEPTSEPTSSSPSPTSEATSAPAPDTASSTG